MARISTSSSGGVVSIQDTNGNPITSSSGAINVNVINTGVAGVSISLYNEVSSIAMGASSNILTYTVPINQIFTLKRINISSDSISTIELDLNGTTNSKGRITYTQFNLSMIYDSYQVISGTVITLIATNNSLQGVASFNATLQGVLN